MNLNAWLPDWQDADAYPKPRPLPHKVDRSILTPLQWRWEFIRRMEDYRAAWADPHTQPVAVVLERYGMRLMIDPASPTAKAGAIVPRPVAIMGSPLNADKLAALADDGYAIVAIDIRATKEEVAHCVWQHISSLRDPERTGPARRWHSDLWPQYLRILDGVAFGATYSQIADALSTPGETLDEKLIRERHKRANVLATQLAK